MKVKDEKEFKAVEFMRKARQKMTEKYLTDRKKYFTELDEVSKRFLSRRKKNHSVNV